MLFDFYSPLVMEVCQGSEKKKMCQNVSRFYCFRVLDISYLFQAIQSLQSEGNLLRTARLVVAYVWWQYNVFKDICVPEISLQCG